MRKTLTMVGAAMAAALAAASIGGAAWAEEPAGDWAGVVTTQGAALRVAIHLHRAPDGSWSGTADSPDQGAFDIPLTRVTASASEVSFDIPAVHGVYKGQWDAAKAAWSGQLVQNGAPLPLDLKRGVLPPLPVIAGLDGDWTGLLQLGPIMSLHLVIHITTGPHGTTATLDSPDQSAYGVPAGAIKRAGDHVSVSLAALRVDYEADLKDGGQTLAGTFTQAGQGFPLTLARHPVGFAAPPAKPAAPAGASDAAEASSGFAAPTDAAIDQILNERIDVQKQGVGIVVGLVDAAGHQRFISEGAFDQVDDRPVGHDTMFEMGSITKVFTATLLTLAVERGEVKLDDPVAKYLPAGVHMPERGGKQITLRDLAQHVSGLPRMPTNFAPKDINNPYADYTDEQLFAFLNSYALPRDIGSKWEYSNLGVGLLGEVLARRAGMSYEALLKTRILDPLGMTSSGITLTPDEKAREAIGHDAYLRRAPYWDLAALSGAGALRSDADDMLTFLSFYMGLKPTPLKSAMDATLAVKRIPNMPDTEQALAWDVRHSPYGDIVWHNGGTGGFRTFIGFNPKEKVGVVVLTNAATQAGGDDIAFHILSGAQLAALSPPGQAPDAGHTAITLPPEKLGAFVGVYQMAPGVTATVTRTGGRLFAQLTGQPAVELFPESATDFFFKVVDAQVKFTLGPDGRATGFVLHQNGRDIPGTRAP